MTTKHTIMIIFLTERKFASHPAHEPVKSGHLLAQKLTYGRYVRVVIRLVAEPVHQTRFADVRVAQHEHLVRFAGVHVTA